MPTKVEKDQLTGTETTGHEWDGIKELNTPLPRWWVWTLYATIVWAIGYWIVYPAWPTVRDYTRGILGWSQYQILADQMQAAQAAKAEYLARIQAASVGEILADKALLDFSLAGGRTAFADNCAPCHGAGGAGAKGYPNLADDDWLWGGGAEAIHTTILYGVRSGHANAHVSEMPAFGTLEILTPDQISDAAEYVLSLSDKSEDQAAAARGAQVFAENCAACHGDNGDGNTDLGAPRLNDGIWLYGGDKADIVETATKSRGGVMPAWEPRLPETTIKMLAVFVHSLGGGK